MASLRSLLFLTLLSLVSAQATSRQPFTFPTASDTLIIGEEIDITWTVDPSIEEVGLSICNAFGNAQAPVCTSIGSGLDNEGSYSWTPGTTFRSSEGYYLVMTTGVDALGASDPFEITDEGSPNTSSRGPSTGAPTTSSPTYTGGSQTTTGGPDASNTGTPSEEENGGGTNGTVIGAAVGAVVVVVIIAVAGFLFMRKKNQRKLAEARGERGSSDDDLEGGKKSNRSSMLGGVNTTPDGAAAVRPRNGGKNGPQSYEPPKAGYSEAGSIPLAELPAMQQEPVEMMAAPAGSSGQPSHFFAMELDSREIPRPGTSSAVKPDVENVTPTRPENRGISIDGTTVNSETERPKTSGTIEQIKEENRDGPSRAAETRRAETPVQQTPAAPAPVATAETNGRTRDGTPQIRNSIPRLPAFEFDSSRF